MFPIGSAAFPNSAKDNSWLALPSKIASTKSPIAEGETVVSLGRFTGVHGVTGKRVEAAYAHVWDVAGGTIRRFRQYIDTLAVAEAQN